MFSFRCNKISETEISEAPADQSGRDSELIMQSRTPVCRNVSAVWDPDAKQSESNGFIFSSPGANQKHYMLFISRRLWR